MKYLQIPDLPGLWWSQLNSSRWVLFELYLTDTRVMMVRPVKTELLSNDGVIKSLMDSSKSDTLDSYLSEGWEFWYGPIEGPHRGPEEKMVFDWIERNGIPADIYFNYQSGCWESSDTTKTRLRDAVLAEIRKEAK